MICITVHFSINYSCKSEITDLGPTIVQQNIRRFNIPVNHFNLIDSFKAFNNMLEKNNSFKLIKKNYSKIKLLRSADHHFSSKDNSANLHHCKILETCRDFKMSWRHDRVVQYVDVEFYLRFLFPF